MTMDPAKLRDRLRGIVRPLGSGAAPRPAPEGVADGTSTDAALALPCGHVFIRDAIQTWLETESAECPVCRHALPSREVITAAAAPAAVAAAVE